MKFSDRTTGLFVAGLGALAWYFGRKLPDVPGQQVGPSIFPIVVGAALVICGLLIAFRIGSGFEEDPELVVSEDGATAREEEVASDWRGGLKVALPPALLLFYALVVEWLGFLPTAFIMVMIIALALKASWRLALGLALIGPPIVNTIFLKLLRVPLPGGFLPLPW